MPVIAKYKIGNSKITIRDDCCVKTEEEKKQILKNISRIVGACLPNGLPEDKPLEFKDPVIDVGVDGNWDDFETKINDGAVAI